VERSVRQTRGLALLVLCALFAAPGAADARPKGPPGHVVYVAKGAVWRAALADPAQPEKLMVLPALRRRFTRLEAAADGSALLVELGRNAAWIDLTAQPPAPVYLPCRGRARLSPSGERVMCASRTGKGTAIYRLRPQLGGAALLAGADPAATNLADLTGEHVVVADKDGLWSWPVGQPEQRTHVAPHVPAGSLSIAPDGQRAVGRYSDPGAGESLFGFRLDGQAARRKLGPGTPVGWSADSVWVVVAAENTACAVKAVGGEYKCWDRFRPLSIDRDGSWLLLAKPPKGKARRLDLFLGRVGGPHVERPLQLLRGASAAVLVP
jgi:hypothetical protein